MEEVSNLELGAFGSCTLLSLLFPSLSVLARVCARVVSPVIEQKREGPDSQAREQSESRLGSSLRNGRGDERGDPLAAPPNRCADNSLRRQLAAHHAPPHLSPPHLSPSSHLNYKTKKHLHAAAEPGATRRSKRGRLVYRLLKEADVRPKLLGEEVHILWPDDGVWYIAVVQQVGVAADPSCCRCCCCICYHRKPHRALLRGADACGDSCARVQSLSGSTRSRLRFVVAQSSNKQRPGVAVAPTRKTERERRRRRPRWRCRRWRSKRHRERAAIASALRPLLSFCSPPPLPLPLRSPLSARGVYSDWQNLLLALRTEQSDGGGTLADRGGGAALFSTPSSTNRESCAMERQQKGQHQQYQQSQQEALGWRRRRSLATKQAAPCQGPGARAA